MSVFFDQEAQESEGSEDEEVREELLRAKKKKSAKSRPEIDSSEEEEDNEDEIAEEMKDLINDEEEEDAEESDDEVSGRKRSHDEEEEDNSDLDSEDLELIEENAGVKIQKKKKFKRIRRISDDEDEDENVDDGEVIARELFGENDDGATPTGDTDPRDRRSRAGDDLDRLDGSGDEESESDEDDFIVDDNDQPISRPKKKKGGNRYTDAAMQQAQEVFGVDFDFDDLEEEDEYEGDEEEDYADDDEEDEDEEGRRRPRKSRGHGRATLKTIYEVYEPAELERSHLTTFDNQIRLKDEPERFQLRSTPVTETHDTELEKEAAWIYEQAFNKKTVSAVDTTEHDPIAGRKADTVVSQIVEALRYMRNEKLETPVIAFYRREYVESLSINDKWVIFEYDEKWCRLQKSKDSLCKLYDDMQEYLQHKLTQSETSDPRIRPIQPFDKERVIKATSQTEIDDCRAHFNLHYSSHLSDMRTYKNGKLKLAKQRKDEEKAAARAARVRDPENPDQEDAEAEKESDPEEEEPENEELQLYERMSRFKISQRKNYYQIYRDMYVGNLVEKFGLKPEAFGENLRDDYQRNNVKQHQVKPLEEAEKQLEEQGNLKISKEDFLKAARFMYAKEISCDPLVRQTIRSFYFEKAVINSKPTLAGLKEIDENHPCYSMKYLRNKPVHSLVRDQFKYLSNAEKDKLIELTITMEAKDNEGRGTSISPYLESLKGLYFSDFSSLVTKEWNDQREEAVKLAMEKFLLPTYEKELRVKLNQECDSKILKTCGQKFFDWLKIAPYVPLSQFEDDEDFELRNGLKVMGFSSPADPGAPSFAVIIDNEGEVLEHVRLPNLLVRKRRDRMNAVEKENQTRDRIKFKQFIMHRKPHVIALAAESVQTKYIWEDLGQLMMELSESEGIPNIPIEIVDNELANVYMNSKKAQEEFPEYPPPLLQAVSIARRLADPLIEFAKLCNEDNEILCIRCHPLQDCVSKEELLTTIHNEFINRVNEVGVDINRAIAHPHTSSVVQFICGLGPRKASHLLRSIRKLKSGQLTSRQQLIKELGMTAVIYINCSGFIKLDTDVLAESYPDEHVTTLDSTRIHPQSYGLAKKIASDALDYEEGASEETTAHAIEEILECPDKLGDLDLDAFAHELDVVRNEGKKTYTLYSIREELTNRYKDLRDPYKAPGQEELFALLTKETPSTFFIGKLITAEVTSIIRKKPSVSEFDGANPTRIDGTGTWKCPFCFRCDFQELSEVWHHYDQNLCPGEAKGLRCRLDNGLQGFVPVKFISDREVVDPSERVAPGMTVHCRITKINIERFSCDLTCRTSDLLDREGKLKPAKDEQYDYKAEEEHEKMEENRNKKQVKRPYCKRIIVHPSFHNIDYKAAEKRLSEMEQGAAIIRPSSVGQNYLTVSWKVADGINQHINIREEGKDNAFSLGHQLFINEESYEDLDEIIARHIQPMASFARDMLIYKYCQKPRDRERDSLSDLLFTEKSKVPGKIHYFLCPSKEYPGKFLLAYLPKNKVRHEYISITPLGYRFRKNIFTSIGQLLRWFKENYHRDPHIMTTDRSLMSISSV